MAVTESLEDDVPLDLPVLSHKNGVKLARVADLFHEERCRLCSRPRRHAGQVSLEAAAVEDNRGQWWLHATDRKLEVDLGPRVS